MVLLQQWRDQVFLVAVSRRIVMGEGRLRHMIHICDLVAYRSIDLAIADRWYHVH